MSIVTIADNPWNTTTELCGYKHGSYHCPEPGQPAWLRVTESVLERLYQE